MNAPPRSPVEAYLRELHARFRDLDAGSVADYIPELAKADPRRFGICIATADGHVYEVGDSRVPFTIQSISKPFAYGLALEDRGKPAVLERIGVEPTGDAFNEISLDADSGRPLNPMINAGAIAATSLIAGHSPSDRWDRILALFAMYAGRALQLDECVYLSERETGHRNRAIGHMLRNFDILDDDPEAALDLYFRQCSIEVTCRDLAVMAVTLATGGVNPVTGERPLRATYVDEVLSLMTTCGMYDYAGEWIYRIGMPAKSGVAGGVLAVLPGQIGIGVFSPPLDARGNSVRGVAVCEALSEDMELHFLRAPRVSLGSLRGRFDLTSFHSKRARGIRERSALDRTGHRAVVVQLQGDLYFAGMEFAVRNLVSEHRDVSHLVLDISRVQDIDAPAARLLLELLQSLAGEGRALAFVGLEDHPRLRRLFEETRSADASRKPLAPLHFGELDLAVEWCEDQLLLAEGISLESAEELPLEKHEFVEGLGDADFERLVSRLERREFAPRRLLVREGEAASDLFLLVRGELSVLAEAMGGRLRRLATLSPGMGFGEPFVFDDATRIAFVRADGPCTCYVLSRSAFRELIAETPELEAKLLRNLLRSAYRILGRTNTEFLSELR